MPKHISLPDGRVVEFPDAMSDDDVSSAIKRDLASKESAASSFASNSGLSALAHPIDTLLGIPAGLKQMATDTVNNAKQGVQEIRTGNTDKGAQDLFTAIPVIGPATRQMSDQFNASNAAGAFGTAAGTVAGLVGPKALKEFGPGAALTTADKTASALETTGEGAQKFAIKRINKTVGSLQADFDHGANPGRQYLKSGLGASTSMDSIAAKARDAASDVGGKLSDLYDKYSSGPSMLNVSPQDVFDAVAKPLKDAHDLTSGFGGSGSTAGIEKYAEGLKPELQNGIARGGFTPRELFDLKQKLTKNINWKSTSDVENSLNNIREAQYGKITELLNRMVPESEGLNRSYGDLKTLEKRAALRAKTGSTPLTNFKEQGFAAGAGATLGSALMGPGMGTVVGGAAGLAADSLPAKTAVASGIYSAGGSATAAGLRLADWLKKVRP